MSTRCHIVVGRHPGEVPMRALSIKQPWAWAILYAGKDVENRSYKLAQRFHGKWVLLHASKKPEHVPAILVGESIVIPPSDLPLGVIVGAIRWSDDQRQCRQSPWAGANSEHWRIAETRPLAAPIECRGMLGFWRPDEQIMATILEQNPWVAEMEAK